MPSVMQVVISTLDVTTMEAAEQLIKEAALMAPVGGVFHLAMLMNDALLVNMVMTPLMVTSFTSTSDGSRRNFVSPPSCCWSVIHLVQLLYICLPSACKTIVVSCVLYQTQLFKISADTG